MKNGESDVFDGNNSKTDGDDQQRQATPGPFPSPGDAEGNEPVDTEGDEPTENESAEVNETHYDRPA